MAHTQKADFRAAALEFPGIIFLVLVSHRILCFRSNLISKSAKYKYLSSQGDKIRAHMSLNIPLQPESAASVNVQEIKAWALVQGMMNGETKLC